MSFKNLYIPQMMDTSSYNLIDDFFIPLLQNAKKYDRGVGFFSAAWMRVAARGMTTFANNGGKARWITSPILDKKDTEALLTGEKARKDQLLKTLLRDSISTLQQDLEEGTLSALSWLVADNILDFRIAIPRNKLEHGNFHDKFGIFQDFDNNYVSFNGSYNDSIQGLLNYESIKIFWDWDLSYKKFVNADINRFEKLWNNEDENVETIILSEAARQQLIQFKSQPRPYSIPSSRVGSSFLGQLTTPHIPQNLILRDYQNDAIEAWFNEDCKGLFEMATGTGKTITALAAITKLIEREKKLLVIIACPFKHLVEQWAEEAIKFGFYPIKVFESRISWHSDLARQIRLMIAGKESVVTIICTNASFTNDIFRDCVKDCFPSAVIVVDEVHSVGSPKLLKSLPEDVPFRLGLSATPFRQYDPEGSDELISYFNKIIYKLGLKESIGKFLTPYKYFPILVPLNSDEFDDYIELTDKIRNILGKNCEEKGQIPEIAKKLLIARARIMNNSQSKVDWVESNFKKYQDINYTIFYVGDKIFQDVTRILGVDKMIRIHRFTSKESTVQRNNILKSFTEQKLQALVAMKCLDEGVDIPPTRNAYFIASSGNPREFIQRRGRVLRKFPGKELANIYDLISVPPFEFLEMGQSHPAFSSVKSILKREYRRLQDFANLAENKNIAMNELFEILDKLNILGED